MKIFRLEEFNDVRRLPLMDGLELLFICSVETVSSAHRELKLIATLVWYKNPI